MVTCGVAVRGGADNSGMGSSWSSSIRDWKPTPRQVVSGGHHPTRLRQEITQLSLFLSIKEVKIMFYTWLSPLDTKKKDDRQTQGAKTDN